MGPPDEEFDDFVDPERDELWNYFPHRKRKQAPVPPGARRGSDAVHTSGEWDRSAINAAAKRLKSDVGET
jgi:hypothetical protein